MHRAVFLDRDGVLNELVLNSVTKEYESPPSPKEMYIPTGIVGALKSLQQKFLLFVVSNQPNYAKGKMSMEALQAVNHAFAQQMQEKGIQFSEYFYCFHHPQGVVKEYSGDCVCRKPKPYFLLKAAEKYELDLARSWMVGDRDTDVQCGKAAGVLTILFEEEHSKKYQGQSKPDYKAASFTEVVKIIVQTI